MLDAVMQCCAQQKLEFPQLVATATERHEVVPLGEQTDTTHLEPQDLFQRDEALNGRGLFNQARAWELFEL